MTPLILCAPLHGWITRLEDVPDPVFAERMLGDGIAIDPVGDCLHAPCAGTVTGVQPTGHALTLDAGGGVAVLIHLGLDTVALGGRGFTPLVGAGDTVETGMPLIRFDLDLLVREARAVVTPVLVVAGDVDVAVHAGPGLVEPGAPLMTLTPRVAAGGPGPAATQGPLAERRITVPMTHGIHARPAARIADFAKRQRATLTLRKGERMADARSPTALLTLGIVHGDVVTVAAEGEDADGAAAALAALIEGGMGEREMGGGGPPPVPAQSTPRPPAPTIPPGALAGVAAAPGLAVGTLRRHRHHEVAVADAGVGIAQEEAAFEAARTALGGDLDARAAVADGAARGIVAAHRALLDDPALVDAARTAIAAGASAGAAWRRAVRDQVDALRAAGNARLMERADDLIDLERQLLARLTGEAATVAAYPAGTLLTADELLPSDLMALDAQSIAAIALAGGGPTSHVAILAASMGVPMLVAVGPALSDVDEGTLAILDADGGFLLPRPDDAQAEIARRAVAAAADRCAAALARAGVACVTADGTRIEVFANLGAADEVAGAVAQGAEGCGLLRTEFLFLHRDVMPTVAEQAAEYQRIADALDGRPLIVRLLDIGGDKPAPYLPFAAEENPALGLRGIRVALAHPAVLEDQLRAILSVRPAGQCRIMLPMVAGVDEVRIVRLVLDRLRAEMGVGTPVELGIMVETPAAAITADLLAAEVDFLSVGSNDLTQYTLAMDRGNAAVAAGVDGLHPAVLRLIGEACRGGARHGRWTGVCGGLASDPLAVPILIGLGVSELSAAPAMVATIKAGVSAVTVEACRTLAEAATACATAAEVRALARKFAGKGVHA